ncbi:PP2C family protein-serine/threonine phosphatase [Camelliibacillus cellulosilyticus]|uniref:PP2C family protein-serine/threonine phosphatase n=1 Tax=Camelliibacillus cellulosilyticus TaxID=2174486 RepID=A0ABV9GL75_9BACL
MVNQDYRYQRYKTLLTEHLKENNEQTLYSGQRLIREMMEQGVSPEEVLSLHIDVLSDIFPNMDKKIESSLHFLLEGMISYGLAYQEHQSLRHKQQQLENEIRIAADVQQSLLVGDVPDYDLLDIGVISRPAKQMSGDYYHFVRDDQNCLSVAIADIVGKGIPAALCMSMIKYAMDSVPEQRMEPSAVLENLNRVVEQNVDPSMFITMLYGIYDARTQRFHFASAGHEPGFYYSKKDNRFEELSAKGRVLGLSRDTTYREYKKQVNIGDMIILLSDGVTECRTKYGFIEREKIVDLMRDHIDLSAQKMAEYVYQELERIQDFQLRDDFTLIILRREV